LRNEEIRAKHAIAALKVGTAWTRMFMGVDNNVIRESAVYAEAVLRVCPVKRAEMVNIANVTSGAIAVVLFAARLVSTGCFKYGELAKL